MQTSPLSSYRILRLPEVERKTGLKRAYLYYLIKQNRFPRQIRLGKRAVGWNCADVDQWIIARLHSVQDESHF